MKKKVYYTSEKDLEGLKWVAKIMDFGVNLMIKAAINELTNAYIMLRERDDLFKWSLKNLANRVIKAAKIKEREILDIMENKNFYDDYADAVIDYAQSDMTKFRVAIKQELDKAHIADSMLYSYIECARVMLNMSVFQYDNIIKEAKERWGRSYAGDFSEFRIGNIYAMWDKVCSKLYDCYSVDLNTPNISSLFDTMCRKFTDGKYIEKCLKAAYENNPDFVKNEVKVKE